MVSKTKEDETGGEQTGRSTKRESGDVCVYEVEREAGEREKVRWRKRNKQLEAV